MRSERQTFSAFVFDLDGTLIDSRPAIEKAAQLAIAAVLPAHQGRCVTDVIGPPIRIMFRRIIGNCDEDTLERLVAAFRVAYDGGVCLETPLYAGASEVLLRIASQGGTNYILTNKPWGPTCRILTHLGIRSHVREIVTPDSREPPFASKTEGLCNLLKRHRLAASDVLMIGDSPDDAEASEACGVAFAAAVYGYGGLDKASNRKNWLIIESPQDILIHLSLKDKDP